MKKNEALHSHKEGAMTLCAKSTSAWLKIIIMVDRIGDRAIISE